MRSEHFASSQTGGSTREGPIAGFDPNPTAPKVRNRELLHQNAFCGEVFRINNQDQWNAKRKCQIYDFWAAFPTICRQVPSCYQAVACKCSNEEVVGGFTLAKEQRSARQHHRPHRKIGDADMSHDGIEARPATTAEHPKYHAAIAHTQPGRDSFSRIRAVPLIPLGTAYRRPRPTALLPSVHPAQWQELAGWSRSPSETTLTSSSRVAPYFIALVWEQDSGHSAL